MALNPEDPSAGFQHNNVVAFINEKMAGHTKGPEFYLENISLSWEEVENKLRDILEDSAVSSKAKDACAWSSLALGMRFACRQSQLHGRRVHWLQDYTKLHKSAAEALASHLKELTAQQEMERKESVFQLRQTQANMAEMRKESDLLRWRILRAELEFPRKRTQVPEEPGLATGSGARTEVAHEEEEEAGAAATSAAGATGRGRSQKDAEGAEATKKLGRGPVHLPGAEEQKNYTSGGQREGERMFDRIPSLYTLDGSSTYSSTVTTENVSRYYNVSTGGQNHPWLGTTEAEPVKRQEEDQKFSLGHIPFDTKQRS
uniref:testis-expressed sequence 13B protein n=1 Tax=Odobenus rosmarus divergens TaxID=9708 RepID=UPI00063C737C|nr:PREDICTED: testis-expressed sequence 13B protein [Odobenus rosmarus divergens]